MSVPSRHSDRQGGFARFLEVFGQDLAQVPRRPLFWVVIVVLGFFALLMSRGTASVQSGDVRVGGARAWITSEFAVSQLLIMLVSIVYSFFVAVAAGMALIRDSDQNVGALLHATRLRPGEYVWGKYAAVLAGFVGVLAVHLGLMIAFNHGMPHAANADAIGPFAWRNYLMPAFVFALPMLVLMSGTSFALGAITRRAVLVFLVPVAVLLFGVFFLWDWSPVWLSPTANRVLQFVDLSGLRWIKETWLDVDKGVAFYNHRPVGLDALIVVQRLCCVALGLAGVALVQARFAASLRGAQAARARKAAAAGALAAGGRAVAGAAAAATAGARPLSALGMRGRAPAFLTSVREVAAVELRELRSQPGLYLFVPMILIQALSNVVATGAFDTTVLNTPGLLAVREMGTLTLLTCLLILFYTTESLHRERGTGFGSIYYAAPLRTSALLLGKTVANVVIALVVMLAALLGSAVVIAVQGKVPFDLGPFALVWGLLLTPTFVLWTSYVCASFAATGNRYATYVLGLVALSLTGFFQARGKMTWPFNWDLWGTTVWSDISVLELDRKAMWLNRVEVLGLAVFFLVIAVRWFPRRERDATRVVHGLRPGALGRHALQLAPFALVPLVTGIVLGLAVYDGREGGKARKLERDYWKKNAATWKDVKLPTLAAVDLDLDVDPARSRLRSRGTYVLVNRTTDTLEAIPLTGGLHWRHVRWTMDGDSAAPEDRAHLYVFRPRTPLAPGGRVAIGWSFDGRFPDGISRNGGRLMEFILPSGVVLTGFSGTGMAPLVGYQPEVGVEEDRNQTDPREYPEDYWKRTLPSGSAMFDGWCDTHMTITGPADMQQNATGALVKETVGHGRRTTEWRSDRPLRAFNLVMGRWQVKRRDGVAVFYDRRHAYNVDEMLDALAAARRWYGECFAPYPWKELRVSEFPGLATYAQGPPTNITFSESIGFLTKSEPKANAAFCVTAHEAAHQWWPLMAMPAEGPGGDVLSEGMAHFSTILLAEQVRGLEQRIAFCREIEDRYVNARRKDSERPLTRMDGSLPGERDAIYDRGGFAFWMLFRLMGREAGLAGVRDYLNTYRDSADHPLIEDYLAVMRRHAPDPAAFDAFTRQWFFGTVLPQFLLADPVVTKIADGWEVTAKLTNTGTGTVPVTVAAARGKRFDAKAPGAGAYADARTTVTLAAGGAATVRIRCPFAPERLVVDPDIELLMLERQKAELKLPKPQAAAVALRHAF